MSRPPKVVIPGLNRGAGIPGGFVLGRRRGSKQGPAELLGYHDWTALGLATTAENTKANSGTASTAQSSTDSLSTSVSTSLSTLTSQVTSLSSGVSTVISGSISSVNSAISSLSTASTDDDSALSTSLSSAVSTNVTQSTSLSQISSSLSGAISSTSSLSTAVSTVISGSVSTLNSRIDSLSTAGGGGGATTFLALTDTPATYVGQAAKVVRVNAGETALEFAAGSVDPGQSTSLSQISSSLSGAISSTSSLSTAVSTVDGNQSTSLSQISAAVAFNGAMVKKSADQIGANYSTSPPIVWDAAIIDPGGWHHFTSTVTITIASPGVITWTAHGLSANAAVSFTTTGALPTGITAGTVYYTINTTANTFQIAATPGGAAINTSGSQSGTHTATCDSILKVPSGVNYVEVGANVRINNLTSTQVILLFLAKNGTSVFDGAAGQNFITGIVNPRTSISSGPIAVVAGDYFEALYSTPDTSIDITASVSNFWIKAIG